MIANVSLQVLVLL